MLGQGSMIAPITLAHDDDDGRQRAVHILARTIGRHLLSQGYELRHLVDLAGELIDVACDAVHLQLTERACPELSRIEDRPADVA